MQSQKHQQEQGISSLFMSQAYTNWEGLIGNISLKDMTYAPYCAQFTHNDRKQNIFLSHLTTHISVSRHFIMCLSFSLFLPIFLLFSILFILHRPCPSPINPITQSPYTGIFS